MQLKIVETSSKMFEKLLKILFLMNFRPFFFNNFQKNFKHKKLLALFQLTKVIHTKYLPNSFGQR